MVEDSYANEGRNPNLTEAYLDQAQACLSRADKMIRELFVDLELARSLLGKARGFILEPPDHA